MEVERPGERGRKQAMGEWGADIADRKKFGGHRQR